jgi:arylsulfatase A-like enzyme
MKNLLITLALILTATAGGIARAEGRANVVFILADDLGYGDLSCYGQKKLSTPNIDRIASEGMRFTDFYAGNTVCTPSRASLMTGCHPGTAHARSNVQGLRAALDPKMTTMPRLFKEAGYATGIFGKWGLGHKTNADDARNPLRHGFDESYCWESQTIAHTYFLPHMVRNGRRIEISKDVYAHDLVIQHAFAFIKRNAKARKPFFCYVPVAVPHAAMHAPKALHEKWRRKLPEFDKKVGKYGAGPYPCPKVVNPIAGFAAMMENLDNQVGELLTMLQDLGIDENTLVIFSSDNGAHREGGHSPGFWASTGPLRGLKRDLYEGGIRVPMMVRWPGTVEPGRTCTLPGAFWDFLPTFADLIRRPVPAQCNGISILPTLTGTGEQKKHDYLYWEYGKKARAVRKGDWKAVALAGKPMQLFNLKEDIGEKKNVAGQHPELVDAMRKIIEEAHTPLPR